MTRAFAVVVGLLLLVLLVLFSTTYTVRFHEVAVKTTFGKEETVQSEPGVHFRYPLFIDRVRTYDKRIQLVETPLVETPTGRRRSADLCHDDAVAAIVVLLERDEPAVP